MNAPILTIFTKSGGILTKRVFLKDGTVAVDATACLMIEGMAQRISVPGAVELADLMAGLSPQQALAFGKTRDDLPEIVTILSQAKLEQLNGAAIGIVSRTKANLVYEPGQPSWALLDFDKKGMPPAVEERIRNCGGPWPAIAAIVPNLDHTERVLRASTSSGLYRTDTGEKLTGQGGLHIDILVKDGSDIERFLRDLHRRCWLAGLGWCIVGAAGQLLERSVVDRVVGSPERLIFEASPIIEPPLAQNLELRCPVPYDGDTLDTAAACPPLSTEEETRYRELLADEASRLGLDVRVARTSFIVQQAKRIVTRTGIAPEAASRIVEQQCRGVLLPQIELTFDDPALSEITVADVLANPLRFAGETLADPLEGVAYGRCKAKILLRDDGTPIIHSFAHGGATYTLRHEELPNAPDERPVVRVIAGMLPHAIDTAERALIEQDVEIFEAPIGPVYIGTETPPKNHFAPYRRRTMIAYESAHLAEHWTRHVDFQKYDGRSKNWRSLDCPVHYATVYLQRKGRRHLRRLRSVISAPTLRPDGSILDRPGYDEETGLLYDPCGVEYPSVPQRPTREDALAALTLLMEPIKMFPFVPDDPLQREISASRSVSLSGILTATIRPSLPTAPLHASTAPIAGSGKSKLDNIAAIISTGRTCHPIAETTSTEEFEKRIATALIKGDPIIGLDNCTVPLGGGLLCQALTEQIINIRDFGFLKDITVENTASIFANGNNLVIQGDIIRRVLRAQLDPGVERPELRKFEFEPLRMVAADRPRLLVAALTILRAHHVAGYPATGLDPLGSFEEWSAWPRAALVWLDQPDPCTTMAAARDTDPDLRRLRALLHAWHPLFSTGATLKRVIAEARLLAPREKIDQRSALLEAIEAIALVRNDIDTRVLGKWLARHKGRVVDGLRLEESGEKRHATMWAVAKHRRE